MFRHEEKGCHHVIIPIIAPGEEKIPTVVVFKSCWEALASKLKNKNVGYESMVYKLDPDKGFSSQDLKSMQKFQEGPVEIHLLAHGFSADAVRSIGESVDLHYDLLADMLSKVWCRPKTHPLVISLVICDAAAENGAHKSFAEKFHSALKNKNIYSIIKARTIAVVIESTGCKKTIAPQTYNLFMREYIKNIRKDLDAANRYEEYQKIYNEEYLKINPLLSKAWENIAIVKRQIKENYELYEQYKSLFGPFLWGDALKALTELNKPVIERQKHWANLLEVYRKDAMSLEIMQGYVLDKMFHLREQGIKVTDNNFLGKTTAQRIEYATQKSLQQPPIELWRDGTVHHAENTKKIFFFNAEDKPCSFFHSYKDKAATQFQLEKLGCFQVKKS